MSWQPYIDDHLLAELPHGGQLEHAAIVGLNGDVWAQSPNFPELEEKEAEAIVKGLSDQSQLAQNGLFVGGHKYIVLAGETGAVIRGKMGQTGITIKKTNTALVIGVYNQTVSAGEANVVVENLGDYLIEQGV